MQLQVRNNTTGRSREAREGIGDRRSSWLTRRDMDTLVDNMCAIMRQAAEAAQSCGEHSCTHHFDAQWEGEAPRWYIRALERVKGRSQDLGHVEIHPSKIAPNPAKPNTRRVTVVITW